MEIKIKGCDYGCPFKRYAERKNTDFCGIKNGHDLIIPGNFDHKGPNHPDWCPLVASDVTVKLHEDEK